VLIDSAPNADAASLAAARVADLILVPCRPAAFDLDAIGTTLNLATVAGKPA
jgi:chromosome partitioning protein